MQDTVPLVDFAPLARMAALVLVIALLPLSWVWLRQRSGHTRARLAALTTLTLFLTFDLIVFGAFTRLSDSGLGCPDWPGCYGAASPLGAQTQIAAAQDAMPTGPVTWSKAWIEMIHRYLAMTVGVLILVMAVVSWLERRRLPHARWWPWATLVWVIVQGLFGKYTVTLKLYPAIVTLHLLGGLALLAMLVVQHQAYRDQALNLGRGLRRALAWVLACSGFPSCNGQWWPTMDFGHGFTLLRDLGHTGDGQLLSFESLVAIHYVHRLFAWVVIAAVAALAWRLWALGPATRRAAVWLFLLLLAQFFSGLSNVVLGWPLVAALGHTAGAAALVGLLTWLLVRARAAGPGQPA